MTPRPVDLARLCLGLVATSSPGSLLPSSTALGGREHAVVRVLGARYLAQSAAGVALPRPWLPPVDAAIDLLHAGSMFALAALDRRHRRVALLSAAVATAFAAADLSDLRKRA